MTEAGVKERDDIQRMIVRSPEAFFGEMGEELLLLGEEVKPTDFVDDRIDLLAVDREGSVAVIELKRGTHKLQLLQAISYASMIANWEAGQILELRGQLCGRPVDEVEDEFAEFLDSEAAGINESQRIILVAEDFDYEVLVAAEWLTEQHGVDVKCYRLTLSRDAENDFLSCTCIYPPPELAEFARRRRVGPKRGLRWNTWKEALEKIDNDAVVEFFRRELEDECENSLRKRILFYRIDGKRRFFVGARSKHAYVWQYSRFKDDERFWRERLGDSADVRPVKEDTGLRFYLREAASFETFRKALKDDVPSFEFDDSG